MTPRWLHWPADTAADWDTNADGVYTSSSMRLDTTFSSLTTVTSSSAYTDIAEVRVLTGSGVQLRASGSSWPTSFAPYLAIWTTWSGDTSASWRTFEWNNTTGFGNRYTLQTGNTGSDDDFSESSVALALVLQTQAGLPTGWSDYS